jgi:hypothetical protein
MTKLAHLISQMEGFGIPGTIPTNRNNPGDLRHGPNAQHLGGDPNAVATYMTAELGWQDLERQLRLYAERGMTIQQAVYCFAPPTENNSAAYLKFVCDGLGLAPNTPMTQALELQA